MNFTIDQLRFDDNGLIPAVIQEASTGTVLMVGFMNRESLAKTLKTGLTWFYSRSRQRLWQKGEQSGHIQKVHDVLIDCDQDTLLIRVEQVGPGACHTGYRSCFHAHVVDQAGTSTSRGDQRMTEKSFDPEKVYGGHDASRIIEDVFAVIMDRKVQPKEGSYTTYLFNEGINKILKKVGEESAEVIIAAKDPDDDPLIYEAADLLYHLLVLFAERGIQPQQVLGELSRRRGSAPVSS